MQPPPDPRSLRTPLADGFEERLAAFRPSDGLPGDSVRHAAVAALLRAHGPELEVLLMTRAERSEDLWSGHVCLPGGAAEPGDPDLLATAVRETGEEVGVDLERCARRLCRLDRIGAIARGRRLPLEITPYVFASTAPPAIALGEEAVDAFWFPLGRAHAGELDDTYAYRHGEVSVALPCWRYEGRTVWGLTHRMLSRLLEVLVPA